jgi:NADH:ubiquinone oxidoreductase subunit E
MRKQRIKVRICVGTACFVQGGADLLLYGDFLDPELLGECDIEGTSCLGGCKAESRDRKAPFVEINGTLHANVTPALLVELLREVAHA